MSIKFNGSGAGVRGTRERDLMNVESSAIVSGVLAMNFSFVPIREIRVFREAADEIGVSFSLQSEPR
jgi:hypothetical protein